MNHYDPLNPPRPGDGPAVEDELWGLQTTRAPSPSVQATMNQMTERLQTVIDAAERAADAIRYDAEEQARRHLAEAQRKADRMTAERVRLIAELTDDLIRHAGTVRAHSEAMVSALEDAIGSVAVKLDEPGLNAPFLINDPGPPEVVEASLVPPPQSWPDDNLPPPPRNSSQPQVSEQALIHATRLAVAGHDRPAIARALQEEFGVADPEPIVDRVLGRT